MGATEEWRDIDWSKAGRYVYKLQKRIYAASREGDVKKVRRLQKTLIRSRSNKLISVRKVTQDNQGKKTAGVDGVKSLSPKARMELVNNLKLTGKSNPTRRVWIPKPGKQEKRPLGIPVMYDRALQAVVKSALEPEWEALFEPNSYGFRPGRSCQDAIKQIKNCIQNKDKFVLDADIAKCFDRIDHLKLLQKIGCKGLVYKQIKSWLKSGVIDEGQFTATSEGTPQGGVISPLLANIALHGLEIMINKEFPVDNANRIRNSRTLYGKIMGGVGVIRYADDFVVLHEEKTIVQRCQELISEWLKDIGLELKPEKTRMAHTLKGELSEDGKPGFNFLGFHIKQVAVGKYRSGSKNTGETKGWVTLINPTKECVERHEERLDAIIRHHNGAPAGALIRALNPVIRGWSNYYRYSDVKTTGTLNKIKYRTVQRLMAWAKRQARNTGSVYKYWASYGGDNWVFTAREDGVTYRLFNHMSVECSSTKYVKVKGDKSPFDGNLVYWSSRLGANPEVPMRTAKLLKKQRGKCAICGLYFKGGEQWETDHIRPKALGGRDVYDNLQLLHKHCHNVKTRADKMQIKVKELSKFMKSLHKSWERMKWEWVDDMPIMYGNS